MREGKGGEGRRRRLPPRFGWQAKTLANYQMLHSFNREEWVGD